MLGLVFLPDKPWLLPTSKIRVNHRDGSRRFLIRFLEHEQLGALFRETGFDVMAVTPRKAHYLWRDHQYYTDFTGLLFRRP